MADSGTVVRCAFPRGIRDGMMETADIRVGTAGWSIPRAAAFRFEAAGTHLQRYSRSLRCAEINSSFHRPHAAATYAKWRHSTPVDFRFAVKMPRTITHDLKLQGARAPCVTFLAQTDGLAEKRGPILVQLPPSLSFDASVVTPFLDVVRQVYNGPLVCEPRHATWFTAAVASLLNCYGISRVAADPPPVRKQPSLRVGRASHIFGYTDRRGSTGHDMTRATSRHLRRPSAVFRPRRKCGACSTTPQAAPRSRMPGSCVNVCSSAPLASKVLLAGEEDRGRLHNAYVGFTLGRMPRDRFGPPCPCRFGANALCAGGLAPLAALRSWPESPVSL